MKPTRVAVGAVLDSQGTLLAHVKHHLYRSRKVYGKDLTDKEAKFIEKLEKDVDDCMRRCGLVRQKVMGTGKFQK